MPAATVASSANFCAEDDLLITHRTIQRSSILSRHDRYWFDCISSASKSTRQFQITNFFSATSDVLTPCVRGGCADRHQTSRAAHSQYKRNSWQRRSRPLHAQVRTRAGNFYLNLTISKNLGVFSYFRCFAQFTQNRIELAIVAKMFSK